MGLGALALGRCRRDGVAETTGRDGLGTHGCNNRPMKLSKRKVLLVGWDAADWKVIHPLMDQG